MNKYWQQIRLIVFGLSSMIAVGLSLQFNLIQTMLKIPASFAVQIDYWVIVVTSITVVSIYAAVAIILHRIKTRKQNQNNINEQITLLRLANSSLEKKLLSKENELQRLHLDNNAKLRALNLSIRTTVAANRSKSKFLADISHEIRTPLNAILGFTELMLNDRTINQGTNSCYLQTIQQGGKQLLELIEDLLDLSRLEADKVVLQKETFLLREVIDETIEILAASASNSGIDLIPILDPSINRAYLGDAKRLKQIITNLISNAIKFTPHGHVCIRAEVDCLDSKTQLQIEVSDTGLGMTEQQLDSMFMPFVQHHNQDTNSKGSGLGLAICQNLIEAFDGKIKVNSKLQEGTHITLALPIEETSNEELDHSNKINSNAVIYHSSPLYSESLCTSLKAIFNSVQDVSHYSELQMLEAKHKQSAQMLFIELNQWHEFTIKKQQNCLTKFKNIILVKSNASDLRLHNQYQDNKFIEFPFTYESVTRTILEPCSDKVNEKSSCYEVIDKPPQLPVLLVDDNLTNLKLLQVFMQQLNIKSQSCSSGIEALRICNKQRFSIIFLDICMPVMNGEETLHKLKHLSSAWQTKPQIVALTANAMVGEKERLLRIGFDDYVSKPISLTRLTALFNDLTEEQNNNRLQSGLDWALSINSCGNDKVLAFEMIQSMLNSIPQLITWLESKNSWHIDDAEVIHKFSGTVSYSGTKNLQHMLIKMEMIIRKNQQQELQSLVPDLLVELRLVLAQGIMLFQKHGRSTEALNKIASV